MGLRGISDVSSHQNYLAEAGISVYWAIVSQNSGTHSRLCMAGPVSSGNTSCLNFKDMKTVVIAWFPKAFTGSCTKECLSFRENGKAIKEFNVAYFTAS